MTKRTLSRWAFLLLAALPVIFSSPLQAADEVLVDRARENIQPAPVVPDDEAEDVKPAEVQLKEPPDKKPNAANPAPANPAPANPVVADEPAVPGGRVKPVVKRPTGRIPLVSKVTNDISKEARVGWAQTHDWPHDEADHSTREEDIALQNRQIIISLMKRQDSHPAVDGYIRWQLLSYAPDLTEATSQQIRSIIANLPELSRLPVPPEPKNILKGGDNGGGAYFFSGVQRAFISDLRPVAGARGYNPTLSVVNTGSGLSFETPEEIIEKSRGAAYDHVASRPVIEKLNIPTVNYRTRLMELIPSEGGLKLEALFADMKDRIEAGDPSYKEACQAFFDEAHAMRNDATIPEKTRWMLHNQMKALGGKKVLVVKDIKIDDAGNMRVARDAVAFPRQHLETALVYLLGPIKTAE